MDKKQATALIGPLGKASKMPCPTYNLPAKNCAAGSFWRVIPGSVCAVCYAQRGRMAMPSAQAAWERNLETWRATDSEAWRGAMVALINGHAYFRWFSSGDIHNADMLDDIIAVCEATPNTRHWLPTKEALLIRGHVDRINDVKNLTVRLSAPMIDGAPNKPRGNIVACQTFDKDAPKGFVCHVTTDARAKSCGDCRACWNATIPVISYKLH